MEVWIKNFYELCRYLIWISLRLCFPVIGHWLRFVENNDYTRRGLISNSFFENWSRIFIMIICVVVWDGTIVWTMTVLILDCKHISREGQRKDN